MRKEQTTTGALAHTITRNGGGFINNEVRAKSYYSSLSIGQKHELVIEFMEYTKVGGKLDLLDWIAEERGWQKG